MNPFALLFPALVCFLVWPTVSIADNAAEETIDQYSSDITVVSAVTSHRKITTTGPAAIDPSYCDNGRHFGSICTRFLEKLIGMPFKEEVTMTAGYECRAVRIVTVSRKGAFEKADGIGFASRGGGEGRYILKEDLSEIGSAVLKNGEPGVLHQFAGLNDCRRIHSGKALGRGEYTFRPYLKFITSRVIYNNWDNVEADYLLSAEITSFNRSRDVLQ